MGLGRTGTTILEILLANNPGIFGVGEINHIFQDGFINDVICSCGKPASKCDVWKTVRQRCDWSEDEIQSLVDLFRAIEWHSKFPILALNLVSRGALRKYYDVNHQLFQAVEYVSGNSVIVESSKYAGRALSLSKVFPGKVWVICLTRSPSGIINSFQKTDAAEQKPKSLMNIMIYYLYVLSCLCVVKWNLGSRVIPIQYEAMISDPHGTLVKIEKWCGFDLSSTRQKLEEDAWLDVGHIVTGNRLRRKERVKFQRSAGLVKEHRLSARAAVLIMDLYRKILRM